MSDWRKIIVSPQMTTRAALSVLDAGALRLVLVADVDGKLLGSLTDGDVRRALLRNQSLETPVGDIMNADPRSALIGTSRNVILALMEEFQLLQVPIVDPDGRLVGLEVYNDVITVPRKDNWVVLMAGGFGKRLGMLTANCPKPMLPVGGKPMLERIMENFIAEGYHKFYISLHYLPEKIKSHFEDGSKWGVTIRYIEEATPLGTGGALGLLPETDGLPVVMMNGDVLTRLDLSALLDFHHKEEAVISLCVRDYEMQVPFGVIQGNGSAVTGIVEKPMQYYFINAGIYVVSPQVVDMVAPRHRLDMPDLIQMLIADKQRVSMFPVHELWLDIGRPDDFERAQQEVLH